MLIDQIVDPIQLIWKVKSSKVVWCSFINAIDIVQAENILGLLISTFKFGSSQVAYANANFGDLVINFNEFVFVFSGVFLNVFDCVFKGVDGGA